MLGYLYVPREDLPRFHAQNKFVHGKFLFWEGWVDVKVKGDFEDGAAEATQATFLGHRDTPENAMQDASRRAVIFLRHRYDDIFARSIFRFIPQEWEGDNIMVPYPEVIGNDQDLEIVREISFGAGQYGQLRKEYLDAHTEITHLREANQDLHNTIGELQEKLRRIQAKPKACQGDQSHGPGAKKRRVTLTQRYLNRFTKMTKGDGSTSQGQKDEGNSLLCDESEIEEEEPMERVMYTSSNPPSDEE
jgi:hypothetical protein